MITRRQPSSGCDGDWRITPVLRHMFFMGTGTLCLCLAGTDLPGGTPDRRLAGGVVQYVIASGDTLHRVGARFAVDVRTLIDDNRLTGDARLAVGQDLLVDHRHIAPRAAEPGAIVINVPPRMLFYVDESGTYGFPVAIGRRAWQTPSGPFTIAAREEDPTWDVPVSILEEARLAGKPLPRTVPPGPANPLGRFWLGLSSAAWASMGRTRRPASTAPSRMDASACTRPTSRGSFRVCASGRSGRVCTSRCCSPRSGTRSSWRSTHQYRRESVGAREKLRELAAADGLTERIDWTRADAAASARHGIVRPVTRDPRARPETTD